MAKLNLCKETKKRIIEEIEETFKKEENIFLRKGYDSLIDSKNYFETYKEKIKNG